MSYTFNESNVIPLKPGDDGYHLIDGVKLTPRAMLGIKHDCPQSIRETLNWALDRGWVVPIANIYKHEQTFNILSDKE